MGFDPLLELMVDGADGEVVEGLEVFAQPATAHGAFFGDAVVALGEDVGFPIAGKEFDFDAGTGEVPGLI